MTVKKETSRRRDPRELLREWANSTDEWVRYIVRQVLLTGGPLKTDELNWAYTLFRQENGLDARGLPVEDQLTEFERDEELIEPLAFASVSDVTGVNALTTGEAIEPHEGLTILFGENGTGKTGYSRIFKALAASRTADQIIGDITANAPQKQSALIKYVLGDEEKAFVWEGQQGVPPFTRVSIFDSPSVSFHVDDDLEYVYVPAALALFNDIGAGIKAVQTRISQALENLKSDSTNLLSRFSAKSSIYLLIQDLGPETDLDQLKASAESDPNVDSRLTDLRRDLGELEANNVDAKIRLQKQAQVALGEAITAAQSLVQFDLTAYNRELAQLAELKTNYSTFRSSLFKAADLPADPDDTWESFIKAGEDYQKHLGVLDAHDSDRCLYCRQTLNEGARSLVNKYSEYLEDKITTELAASKKRLSDLMAPIVAVKVDSAALYAGEYAEADDKPAFYSELQRTLTTLDELTKHFQTSARIETDTLLRVPVDMTVFTAALENTILDLDKWTQQAANHLEDRQAKEKEIVDLQDRAELAKSWSLIETHALQAREARKLESLSKNIPALLRTVTSLAKKASDQLVNESFDALFTEECEALRAPVLPVEFIGRQGRAHRRKVLRGEHKPSKILSEGEQKVLAMADFIAEARLSDTAAPVIFDDPVSSLDHRRIDEVAQRITSLAESTQVIVFTHDILFTITLLDLMETSKRCSYFQISDEGGKGRITRMDHPRWDSLSKLTKRINSTIQAAENQEGETRAALVRTGYSWIRSWCEVFTEMELLQEVTQRYQPHVRMTNLSKIKPSALPSAVETIDRIFQEACRYIDGHSQPLPTLSTSPTLTGLKGHWEELQQTRKDYRNADS